MQHAGVIAVAGAISNIRVKFADGQTADFSSYQPIDLDEGDEFHIQPPTAYKKLSGSSWWYRR